MRKRDNNEHTHKKLAVYEQKCKRFFNQEMVLSLTIMQHFFVQVRNGMRVVIQGNAY